MNEKVLMLKNNIIVVQISYILDTDFHFLMHNYRENASVYVEDKTLMSGYYYF